MSKMHKCVVPKLGEYIYALFPHSYTEAVLQVIKHASDELLLSARFSEHIQTLHTCILSL